MNRRDFLAAMAAVAAARAQTSREPGDIILQALVEELERSRTLRIMGVAKPYFFEYAIHDGESFTAAATLGALLRSNRSGYRLPRIQVRVGDYTFDNTNYVGTDFVGGPRYDVESFPTDNSPAALRRHLWLATDAAYKAAIEAISRKRSALQNISTPSDLPDFAHAEPVRLLNEVRPIRFDEEGWKSRVKRLSAVFVDFPRVAASSVDIQSGWSTHYIVTSEGTRVRVPEGMTAVQVRAEAYAPDGMLLRDAVVFQTLDPNRLPPDPEMERGTREVGSNLTALADAPIGEAYTGPVLFEGIAGPQMLAQVLARNLALPRRPVSNPGRPAPFSPSELEGRINSRVLPEWIDVVDDPTQAEWQGRPLFGRYMIDLEGVPPKPLVLVEKGDLKAFLLTRQPVKGFDGSNGRARLPGMFGHKTAACGNLFVRASETVSGAALKAKLIDVCTRRNKPYGLIVRKLDFPSSASFTEIRRMLTAAGAGARTVSPPVMVFRVYPDGREELVRGLRFRTLAARSLRDILAASDETFVFDFLDNGAPFAVMGGGNFVAETSVIAPSVLIDDVELEPAQADYPRPPLVPPPPLT